MAPAAACPRRSAISAILTGRCPKCREGTIYAGGGRTHPRCPICGLSFEREEGYFLGAMYFSYFLAVGLSVACFMVGGVLLPDWPREWVAGLALVALILAAPLLARYARVLWIHYDRWVWPGADFHEPAKGGTSELHARDRARSAGGGRA